MAKHCPSGIGIAPTMNIAWSSYARRESGAVQLIPQGVGVFTGNTIEEAVAKVEQFNRALIEGGI